MNFWSKLWRKNNISESSETHSDRKEAELKQELPGRSVKEPKPERTDSIVHNEQDELLQILLEVGQSAYEATWFDIDFNQEKDREGRPDGCVYGGIISLKLKETESESILYEWLAQTRVRHQGSVRIYRKCNGKVSREPICNIIFKEACCIGYHKHLREVTSDCVTELKIISRYLKIGDEEFENNWRN